MRLLVFDIDPGNREAALRSLAVHDPTIVATFAEAQAALVQKNDIPFDAVLTNLFVPASEEVHNGGTHAGPVEEMPLGIAILVMALHAGVKNVAVVIDAKQREHPAVVALRAMANASPANVLCTTRVNILRWDEDAGEPADPNRVGGTPNYDDGDPKGFLWLSRDWRELLDRLMAQANPST